MASERRCFKARLGSGNHEIKVKTFTAGLGVKRMPVRGADRGRRPVFGRPLERFQRRWNTARRISGNRSRNGMNYTRLLAIRCWWAGSGEVWSAPRWDVMAGPTNRREGPEAVSDTRMERGRHLM